MTLEVHPALESAFVEADRPDEALDEYLLRDRLGRVMQDLGTQTPERRKGNFAVVGALDFQHLRLHGAPVWDMHWQPLSTIVDDAGTDHHSPEVRLVDDEVIREWCERAPRTRHPLLRARYADLAWEIARFRRAELSVRADVGLARMAIDGYLDAVERSLTPEDLYAWNYIERAIELAARISDTARMQRAKQVLFQFRADAEVRDPRYPFWRFDAIAWSNAAALTLSDADRAVIVDALERQLEAHSRGTDSPHLARNAADCLGRWRRFANEPGEARRAALTAGAAFEAAAAQASGLTAIAWLSEQADRYRQIGDEDGLARVERAIQARAEDAQGEMRRISVPLDITPEQVAAWADAVAGENLHAGLMQFAVEGLVGRSSTERAVLESAAQSPLSAHIPIMITGRDGRARATIGPVETDLDGRTVHLATQLLSQRGPWLNAAWERIREKHAVDLDGLIAWLAPCPFLASRIRFIREGLAAWLAGDMVKAIHVLVPQVEAALRDVLAAVGGAVTKPDPNGGGSQVISLGEVLSHERFREKVPEDIRFHFKILYQDSRGLNVRNDLAHGIAAFELFDRGAAHLVVHSIIVIGTLRGERKPPHAAEPPPATDAGGGEAIAPTASAAAT